MISSSLYANGAMLQCRAVREVNGEDDNIRVNVGIDGNMHIIDDIDDNMHIIDDIDDNIHIIDNNIHIIDDFDDFDDTDDNHHGHDMHDSIDDNIHIIDDIDDIPGILAVPAPGPAADEPADALQGRVHRVEPTVSVLLFGRPPEQADAGAVVVHGGRRTAETHNPQIDSELAFSLSARYARLSGCRGAGCTQGSRMPARLGKLRRVPRHGVSADRWRESVLMRPAHDSEQMRARIPAACASRCSAADGQ
jgi:hypothetical protein